MIADGDFTTNLSVMQMAERGIEFIGTQDRQGKRERDRTGEVFIRSFNAIASATMPSRTAMCVPQATCWFSVRQTNCRTAGRIAFTKLAGRTAVRVNIGSVAVLTTPVEAESLHTEWNSQR